MIMGYGIDLQEIAGIQKAYEKRPAFAKKVLTDSEFQVFEGLAFSRKMSYLAGRWAGKEAFAKALGTGIGKVTFQDIVILNDDKGRPILQSNHFSGKVWLSISHSGGFAQASVILEAVDD